MSSDRDTTLAELIARAQTFVADREWESYHDARRLATSISIEAAELLEKFQWVRDDELAEHLSDDETLAGIRDELADVVIYCMNFSSVTGTDLTQAILSKIEANETKYPVDQVRGSYGKYTDLTRD